MLFSSPYYTAFITKGSDYRVGLAPVELEQGGLDAALKRLAANAEHLFDIRCTAETVGVQEAALPDTVPTHLFRIAQEAVSNAVRHGRARHVAITIACGPEYLRLRIHNDGCGVLVTLRTGGAETVEEFTAPADGSGHSVSAPVRPDDNRGMGLRIMHYRARVLGGRLEIRPGPERGTVVTCTIPLTHRAPSELSDAQAP